MTEKFKIAIVGLGSIGKRHLVNIDHVLKNRKFDFSIDLIRRDKNAILDETVEKYIENIYSEDNMPSKSYDAIFITNPTHLHYITLKKLSKICSNFFIEKPIFDDVYADLDELELNDKGNYYVACPLRYTNVLQFVKNSIDLSKVRSIRAICSSYLPDWRPGTDYRATYSANIEQGGGVSIDLIHEWDYIMYLFGKPNDVVNLRGKFSKLEISSDDLSVYIAAYDTMLAEVHLDYFGRKPVRELQLFTDEDTIIADIINSEIRFLKTGDTIRFDEERNEYQIREIEYFFDVLEGKCKNENNIDQALSTLKIAKEGRL